MGKDAECLKGFRYVLYEHEIDFNRLENTQGFREILPKARRWGSEMQRRLDGPGQIFLNLIPCDTTNFGEFDERQILDPESFARRLKRPQDT